jgi:Fic family protein
MKPRNPWQELLVTAIRTKVAPPRPEGFFTREEIAKEWGLKLNTATRHLDTLLKQKKVEMIKKNNNKKNMMSLRAEVATSA